MHDSHLLRHDLQCLEVVLQVSPTCTHTGILPLISQISGNPSQLVLRCKTGHPVVWKGREGVVEVVVVVLLSTLGVYKVQQKAPAPKEELFYCPRDHFV